MDQPSTMEQYHAYLEKHYKCGVERFFSPTGALERFQRTVEISSKRTREVVVAKNVEDAVSKLRSIVDGGEGVYDLASEPGSGKTSVLPFKFPSKKVVVALPSPFDAWSAYQMATGKACLRLKGLSLGDKSTGVCYTDSYLAANMILSSFDEYDIMIVDECDSGKGVTKFLADVAVKGKVVVRMSASHGRSVSGPSRAFVVTEDKSLPDIRSGVEGFVRAIKPRLSKRSLVLLPDSQTAKDVSDKLPGSKLISSSSGLRSLALCVLDQCADVVYVADDVCARGLNLNLDVLLDSQLITEHGVIRHLTDAELYQRKGRVGRNKPGWYVSPGLPTTQLRESEADILRSNIMRAIAGIEQYGPVDRHVCIEDAEKLMDADVEPITIHRFGPKIKAIKRQASVSSSDDKVEFIESTHCRSPSKSSSDRSSVAAPGWLNWLMPRDAVQEVSGKRFYVSEQIVPELVKGTSESKQLVHRSKHRRHHSKDLAVAESAPYAIVPKAKTGFSLSTVSIPEMPPQVDLTELTYHMDWPLALKDCVSRGGDLPTIVPPGNWRHTSVGGIGTDWYRRLEHLATQELSFVESEFEVVCRAWNRMVAEAWVRRTPGLSSSCNEDRLEFCLRYFQSYFLICAM